MWPAGRTACIAGHSPVPFAFDEHDCGVRPPVVDQFNQRVVYNPMVWIAVEFPPTVFDVFGSQADPSKDLVDHPNGVGIVKVRLWAQPMEFGSH